MLTFSGWLSATLITFIPMTVFFVCVYCLIRIIRNNEPLNKILPEFKFKYLVVVLTGCLLYSSFNTANRPKMDTTPDRTYEQQVYKQQLEQKAKKEIIPVDSIEDSYDNRKSEILNQFNYKKENK